MPLDRRLEAAQQYSEEGLGQCRDIVAFLKKRQALEQDYAKALAKLCAGMAVPKKRASRARSTAADSTSTAARPKASVSTTSLWSGFLDVVEETNNIATDHEKLCRTLDVTMIEPLNQYIKDWEATRKQLMADAMKSTVSLQEAYTQLKKAKTDYDDLQRLADDAAEKSRTAQSNPATKEKDLEKVIVKAQQTDQKAQDAKRVWLDKDDGSRQSQEQFYSAALPDLLDKFQALERERLAATQQIIVKYYETEQMYVVDHSVHCTSMQEKMKEVDLDEDLQEYLEDHFHDDRHGTNVSVRSLINPTRTGRLMRQTNENIFSPDWKLRYCVLMASEQKLYMFESEDAIKPKQIVELATSQTHALDDSYFERKHCFQIISSDYLVKKDISRIFFLAAENEHDKAEWIRQLRQCDFTRFISTMQGDEYRTIKSLKIEVVEARDLPSSDIIRRSSDPFCILSLGWVKQARTVIKLNTLSPFWGEVFLFDDIAHNHRHLLIEICSQNRIGMQRYSTLAKVQLSLDTLAANVEQEEWHTCQPPASDNDNSKFVISMADLGSIRLKTTLIVEKILPTEEYTRLRECLFTPDLSALLILSSILKQKEEFARCLLRYSASQETEVDLLRKLTSQEIESTDDPNIIFRGNSLATKSLDQYMKMIGMDYLQNTLKTLVRTVYKDRESCEVDPTRIDKNEDLKRNWKRLLAYVTQFWDTISMAADKCPWELRAVLGSVAKDTLAKFNNDKVRHTAVSGFIFLRFFCPAILDPKLFGMATEHPDTNTGRTLTLIAKTIQNLANLVEFGVKEPYMADMNPFIIRSLDSARAVVDKFALLPTTSAPQSPSMDISAIDSNREIAAVYRVLRGKLDDLRTANDQQPNNSVTQMIDILTSLDATYEDYEQRAQTGQLRGSVGTAPAAPAAVLDLQRHKRTFSGTSGTTSPDSVSSPSMDRSRSPTMGFPAPPLRPAPTIPSGAAATGSGPSASPTKLPSVLPLAHITKSVSSMTVQRSSDELLGPPASTPPSVSPSASSTSLSSSATATATPPPILTSMGRKLSFHRSSGDVGPAPTSAPPSGPPPIIARKPSISQDLNDLGPTPSTPPPIRARKPSIHSGDVATFPTGPVPATPAVWKIRAPLLPPPPTAPPLNEPNPSLTVESSSSGPNPTSLVPARRSAEDHSVSPNPTLSAAVSVAKPRGPSIFSRPPGSM